MRVWSRLAWLVATMLTFFAVSTVALPAAQAQSVAPTAYGPCNGTVKRTDGLAPNNYYRIPKRTNNGLNCYLAWQEGGKEAVKALQGAVLRCYDDTYAARRINATGGADGTYGTGTVDAVRWLQNNRLGLTGDGVYGPATRKKMKWPFYAEPSGSVRSCQNPPF